MRCFYYKQVSLASESKSLNAIWGGYGFYLIAKRTEENRIFSSPCSFMRIAEAVYLALPLYQFSDSVRPAVSVPDCPEHRASRRGHWCS